MRPALLLAPLLLAACASTATPVATPPLSGSCNAAPAQGFVGQLATQDLGTRMMAASGARLLRWVGFGRMVTMEFNADRLTVRLDPTNHVASVNCT